MTNNFYRIRCSKCRNEQIAFDRTTSKVKCLICGKTLVEPRGGKAKINATILEILN